MKPEQASHSQEMAAHELQHFLSEVTGTTLPVVSESDSTTPSILLGTTRLAKRLLPDVDWKELGNEGFCLRTVGEHLVILGGPGRGPLYGVYEVLERFAGCRWYASFCSVVPKSRNFVIPELDEVHRPAFSLRDIFWFDMFDPVLARRNRSNGREEDYRFCEGLGVHTAFRLVPPGEFFASNPEFYSEINGKRVPEQLCWSNPEVLSIATDRILERLCSDPGAAFVSMSQNDEEGFCHCSSCSEVNHREGSPAGSLIAFVNSAAESIEREFPNVLVETLAYQATRKPPAHLKPRHNVVPRLCSIECDFARPIDSSDHPQNRRFLDDLRGWSEISTRLLIWDYTTNFGHYLGPHPNFAALQGNAELFRECGAVGVLEQGNYQGPHGEFAELRAWVLSKLLWNPDRSMDELYDDFFSGYYGAAAEPVRTYFEELQALIKSRRHKLFMNSPMDAPWYTDAFFRRAGELWAEAERLASDDPAASYRVRMGALPVLHARLYRSRPTKVSWKLHDGLVKASGIDPGYVKLGQEFLSRLDEGRIHVVAETNGGRPYLRELRGLSRGYSTVSLSTEGLRAALAPDLAGRVVGLEFGGTPNLLRSDFGVDFVDGFGGLDRLSDKPFILKSQSETEARLERPVPGLYVMTRSACLGENKLRLSTSLLPTDPSQDIQPMQRVSLNLGDANLLYYKTGAEHAEWVPLGVESDRVFQLFEVPVDSLQGGLTIASAKSGLAVTLAFCEVRPYRCLITVDLVGHAAGVFIFHDPAGGVPDLPLSWPLELGRGKAPPLQRRSMQSHRPEYFLLEECMGHLNSHWGRVVPDAETKNGYAAQLFNTHCKRCWRWPIKPGYFMPGRSYNVRFRVRVDPTHEGEAFWAGVQHSLTGVEFLQRSVRTDEIEPGYCWYSAGTWTPEADHYVWIGPGRFEAGRRSAVNAVFVDKVELVLS